MRSRNPFDVMYDIGLPQIVHFYMNDNVHPMRFLYTKEIHNQEIPWSNLDAECDE